MLERCALEESFVRRFADSLFAISVRVSVNDPVSKKNPGMTVRANNERQSDVTV